MGGTPWGTPYLSSRWLPDRPRTRGSAVAVALGQPMFVTAAWSVPRWAHYCLHLEPRARTVSEVMTSRALTLSWASRFIASALSSITLTPIARSHR